jgi:hypothetical protein
MMLNTEQARSLKITLDALGQPIENIAFDPELHARYNQLRKDQLLLSAGLSGDYEGSMKQIRDVMFEFTRMEVEFKYFTYSVAKNVFQALGGGDFTKSLHGLNDFIIKNIPMWSREFSTYLVPVLKITLGIFKDLAVIFIKLEPLILVMLKGVKVLLDTLLKIVDIYGKVFGSISDAITGKSSIWDHVKALIAQGPWWDRKQTAAPSATGGASNAPSATGGAKTGTTADQVRLLAGKVGMALGVDPSIIFAQWAHETGNFTNRGAKSLNNLAGIENADGSYRSFGSLNDFASYYTNLIQRKYTSAIGSSTIDDYAKVLKKGGYFADSLDNYEHGMKNFQGAYANGGNSSSSISVGDIHITQPGLTNEQVGNIVVKKIKQHISLQTKHGLIQTRTVYA